MLFFCIFKDQAVFELCSVAQALQGISNNFHAQNASISNLFEFQLSVWLLVSCVSPRDGTTKMSVEFVAKRPEITALAFVALDGPSSWPLYAS